MQSLTDNCYPILPPLSVSPRLSGDLPADAGLVIAGVCQVLPSALPPRSPDWNHPHWPGGLLGETATDTNLWSTLCYMNVTRGNLAVHRTTSHLSWSDKIVFLSLLYAVYKPLHAEQVVCVIHVIWCQWHLRERLERLQSNRIIRSCCLLVK